MAISLRNAQRQDQDDIQDLIRQERLNPLGMDWRRFIMAIDESGRMVGCGQVKPHGDSSHELASIAVRHEWRRQGVARSIILHLLAAHDAIHPGQPLFLTCRSQLGPMYEQFGFRQVEAKEMPAYFRRVHYLFRWLRKIGLIPVDLWVMKRP